MAPLLKDLSLTKQDTTDSRDRPLILADNLGVKYDSENKKKDDFKSHTHNFFASLFQPGEKVQKDTLWALQDVSFESYPGDILGVLGLNGAGKTTLCRAVLGLLRPNTGHLEVNGEISSLMSLGAGFDSLLSGRDNIYLNGMMLGMSRKRIRELQPLIEAFSDLDPKFKNMPLKHYSKGMKARLGFSVAAMLEAEVLVIDEVLGAGDLAFQDKASQKMQELVSSAKMVMIVTHNPGFVKDNCNKALWLDQGKLMAFGDAKEVAEQYEEFAESKKKPKKKKVLSLCETEAEPGYAETVDVNNLGIRFNLEGKPFWALKEVSFTVREQEIVGVIGPNGAGKTTLCRALCSLYREDEGTVSINGNITALLGFSAGFDGQLNAVDNIYLNGMMLGMPKKHVTEYETDIIEFAELKKVIYRAVKYYSSGMKTRLGFSIATILNPDILVIDEALSAGDVTFQEKAAERMQDMISDCKSVIIVTHSLTVVEKLCTRAIWLDQGQIKHDGDPKETVKLYKDFTKKK